MGETRSALGKLVPVGPGTRPARAVGEQPTWSTRAATSSAKRSGRGLETERQAEQLAGRQPELGQLRLAATVLLLETRQQPRHELGAGAGAPGGSKHQVGFDFGLPVRRCHPIKASPPAVEVRQGRGGWRQLPEGSAARACGARPSGWAQRARTGLKLRGRSKRCKNDAKASRAF
jgi:hypothetical protein